MKTIKTNLSENVSEIQIINALISAGQEMVKIETIYKSTARDFAKKFGFKNECPNFYVKDDMFWKLCYGSYKSSATGKVREYLDYLPMASAKGKFDKYRIN